MLETQPELIMRAGRYEASIAPNAGGRVTRLSWVNDWGHRAELLVPLTSANFDPHQWPKAGAFPMIPFANRLPDAGIFSELEWGKIVSVSPNGRQHGLVHRRAWKVNSANKSHVHLSFTHDQVSVDWPWRFSAEMEMDLHDDGMVVVIRLTNNAEQPMPAVIGWHPYHPLASTQDNAAALVLEAKQRIPLEKSGRISPRHKWSSFSAFAALDTVIETTAFSGWKHDARLKKSLDIEVQIGGQGWDHLVVHRPVDSNYICIEPVTLLPGEIGQTVDPNGLGMLLSGETLTAIWTCAARTT